MLNLLSRISFKRTQYLSSRYFASPRLLQLQTKIHNSQLQSSELPQIIGDVKEAILESKQDLTQFQAPKTLGKLIQELNTNAKSQAFNEMIKLMNDVVDLELPGDSQYDSLWKELESYTLANITALDAQTLVNTVYYFTKMQQGSAQFMSALQKALLQSGLSGPQAARTLLAAIMAEQVDKKLIQKLIGVIRTNIDTLQEKDIYYVAMTLPQPGFQPFLTEELVLKTQKKCKEFLGTFDLLQLSQIMTAFQSSAQPDFVAAFETQIKDALENFKKYKDKIKVDNFLGDLIRNFGSAAYCASPLSAQFWTEAERITSQHVAKIPEQLLEMLMISFMRAGILIKQEFATALVEELLKRDLIQEKKINELSILSFLTEYRVESQKAYFQVVGNVTEELKKGTQINVPLDILAILAFSFARRFGPSQEPRVAELYKLLQEHIGASKDKGSFPTITNILSFLGNAEIKDDKLKTRFQEELLEIDFNMIPFGAEEFLTLLSIMIQGEMFNDKLWEKAYLAVENKVDSFQRLEFIRLFVTCSQLGLARPQLWEKVKTRIIGELENYSPDQFLEMHNCIAIEELQIPGFWSKVKKLIEQPLPIPEIVNLGWSFGKIEDKDPEFWKAYEAQLISHSQNLSFQDLHNILLAMKKNASLSSKFWEVIRSKIKEQVQADRNIPAEALHSIMEELKAQNIAENGPLLVELKQALDKSLKKE